MRKCAPAFIILEIPREQNDMAQRSEPPFMQLSVRAYFGFQGRYSSFWEGCSWFICVVGIDEVPKDTLSPRADTALPTM